MSSISFIRQKAILQVDRLAVDLNLTNRQMTRALARSLKRFTWNDPSASCKSVNQSWLVSSLIVIGRCANFNVKLLQEFSVIPRKPFLKSKLSFAVMLATRYLHYICLHFLLATLLNVFYQHVLILQRNSHLFC